MGVAALEDGRRPRPFPIGQMMQRRGLMFIVMAGCWIVLLAFVLTFALQTAKLAKQHRSKDRQSAQTW
jgi:phosphotransferase system  glucose/maltose/N-acetylglucosamine-specific IIC component